MWLVLATFALIHGVSALSIGHSPGDFVKRNGRTRRIASFDDLKPGAVVILNSVPVPYQGLNYSKYVFQDAGTLGAAPGVLPESPSNYAAYGPASSLMSPNVVSTKGTNTKFFDLSYLYFGCPTATFAEQAQFSTPCRVSLTPKRNGKAGKSKALSYNPSSLTNATMARAEFGLSFKSLTDLDIIVTYSTISALNVFLLDNVTYATYG